MLTLHAFILPCAFPRQATGFKVQPASSNRWEIEFLEQVVQGFLQQSLDRVPLLGGQYTELLVNCDVRSVRLLSAYPRPVWASLFRQVSFSRPARRRSGIGFQLAHCFGQGILRLARHGSSVLGVYRVIRSQTQARSLRISAAALPSGSCSTTPSPIGRGSPRRGLRRRPCGDTLLVELRPLLHIHPPPQNSKRLHLRFHLGRADHPERVK